MLNLCLHIVIYRGHGIIHERPEDLSVPECLGSFCLCVPVCPYTAHILPVLYYFVGVFLFAITHFRIFFFGWVCLLVSRLKELMKGEMIKRVPCLDTASDNYVWRTGRALNWAELVLGCWGPSEGKNAEESKWNWKIRWRFPLLFLPKGPRVSISWPQNQRDSLAKCPRLPQCILKFNSRL